MCCYEQNVYTFRQFVCWSPSLQCDRIWWWSLLEVMMTSWGWSLLNAISALKRLASSLLTSCEDTRRWLPAALKRALLEPSWADPMILNFQLPELREINVVYELPCLVFCYSCPSWDSILILEQLWKYRLVKAVPLFLPSWANDLSCN